MYPLTVLSAVVKAGQVTFPSGTSMSAQETLKIYTYMASRAGNDWHFNFRI